MLRDARVPRAPQHEGLRARHALPPHPEERSEGPIDRNIAYLRLRPKGKEIETVRVSDELNVDIAPDGSVYDIELLNANEQLRAADGGRLVLVEKDGREQAIPLSPP